MSNLLRRASRIIAWKPGRRSVDGRGDCQGDRQGTTTAFMLGFPHQPAKEDALSALSVPELTKVRDVLARVLSMEEVNQLGRAPGQARRLRTVTPHRLF